MFLIFVMEMIYIHWSSKFLKRLISDENANMMVRSDWETYKTPEIFCVCVLKWVVISVARALQCSVSVYLLPCLIFPSVMF